VPISALVLPLATIRKTSHSRLESLSDISEPGTAPVAGRLSYRCKSRLARLGVMDARH
jgi:hypothetical protein